MIVSLVGHDVVEAEYRLRAKLISIGNRDKFLLYCLEEQVLPRSAPRCFHIKNKLFSSTAREYLKEAQEKLSHEATLTKDDLRQICLPSSVIRGLEEDNQQQRIRVSIKLAELYVNSM